MIIFDYGQTLLDEVQINLYRGTEAVLESAISNPLDLSVKEVYKVSNELYAETVKRKDMSTLEVHNHHFQNYLYEYLGIRFDKTPNEIERIFVNAALTSVPTKDIELLLKHLDESGIRTGVISNITFSGNLLSEIIYSCITSHKFEFIVASSEYIFRKPEKRIFELALRKANLLPSEVWYCGDNPICDVEGALTSGIFPIWYRGASQIEIANKPSGEYLEILEWKELINYISDCEE
jgi:putative hydrolase of the HAD superfamily